MCHHYDLQKTRYKNSENDARVLRGAVIMKRPSVSGFLKYWPSGKRFRLLIEQFNGQALVNYTAFLGKQNNNCFHPQSKKCEAGARTGRRTTATVMRKRIKGCVLFPREPSSLTCGTFIPGTSPPMWLSSSARSEDHRLH